MPKAHGHLFGAEVMQIYWACQLIIERAFNASIIIDGRRRWRKDVFEQKCLQRKRKKGANGARLGGVEAVEDRGGWTKMEKQRTKIGKCLFADRRLWFWPTLKRNDSKCRDAILLLWFSVHIDVEAGDDDDYDDGDDDKWIRIKEDEEEEDDVRTSMK